MHSGKFFSGKPASCQAITGSDFKKPENGLDVFCFLASLCLALSIGRAEGVVAGKAEQATKAEAITNLEKYRKPIIVTKVSGKHAEICPMWAKPCIYRNM